VGGLFRGNAHAFLRSPREVSLWSSARAESPVKSDRCTKFSCGTQTLTNRFVHGPQDPIAALCRQLVWLDAETAEYRELRLAHCAEAEQFYWELKQEGVSVRVGMELPDIRVGLSILRTVM